MGWGRLFNGRCPRAARATARRSEQAIWSRTRRRLDQLPACLGRTREASAPSRWAITQLLLLYHLLDASRLADTGRLAGEYPASEEVGWL